MSHRENELLRIYNQGILPDSLEKTDTPKRFPSFPLTSAHEVEHYSAGLERNLILLQEEINDMLCEMRKVRADAARFNVERANLTNEIEALRWQVEYDKKLMHDIRTSRAWGIARLFHFLYGYLTLNREIIKESKSFVDDVTLAQTGASKFFVLIYYMLNGAAKTAKRFGKAPTPEIAMNAGDSLLDQITYQSCYQDDEPFRQIPRDVKTIAFYLPQFHTFPENDEWWGKGFTEWTNTKKAKPRFPVHYQPRTPHKDIGYYDLSDVENIKKQVALAKAHGISAFCLYYYWFDGKKLMEKPLELIMAHPEIDFNFCLCWANENWTRTWDGQQNSVLIKQNYSDENDINFIKDLKRYIMDPRYLRCQGKPVILVYHAKILPNSNKTFATWRSWCRKNGVGEIQIWSCRTFIRSKEFRILDEVDREVEFPPHMVSELEMFPPARFHAFKEDGYYYNYQKIISDLYQKKTFADQSPYPFYRCAMLGWDNSCRRETGYSVWQYFSLNSYHYWLRNILEYTRKNFIEKERFIFINAWNEWAEGTYLEPDECFGYASINTTTRALCNLPPVPDYEVLAQAKDTAVQPGKVLLHVHVFYPDLMDEIIHYLNQIPFKFDCVVTTDSRRKRTAIMTMLEETPVANCENMTVTVTRNVGRDVAPFFAACSELIDQYDFIGHFHTKKSMTVNWGHEWRHYLLDQLLGSPETVASIFRRFDRDPHIGLYFPSPIPTMRDYMNWEKNLARCVDLLNAMGLPSNLPPNPDFPVGQMFWARAKAIAPLFREGIVDQAKFEEENYQISDTLAHAIERIWKYVAQGAGYTTLSAVVPPPIPPEKKAEPGEEKEYVKRLAIFVHYSADQKVSPADMYLLGELKKCADIVFVSNSGLIQESMKKVSRIAAKVITRENVGYDFGAWRDALEETRLTGYDELVLLNNSVYGPMYSFQEIFARMSSNPADFWGMTEFPETDNPRREEAKWLPNGIIPRHIQSYFLVFRQQVFSSEAFKDFWRNVKDETSLPAVVANYETRLSSKLEKAGFKSDVYLRSAARLQEVDKITPEFNAIYCRPQDFLVLGFPFLKKNICYYLKQPEINETIHLISRLYQYPTNFIKITAKTR